MDIEHLLSTRPARRVDQAAWYSELLTYADQNDLSSSELASLAGLSLGTIYNWKRRLAQAAPDLDFSGIPPQRLVRVQVAPSSGPRVEPRHFELRLSRGRSILVPPGFDQGALVSLVEVLERC